MRIAGAMSEARGIACLLSVIAALGACATTGGGAGAPSDPKGLVGNPAPDFQVTAVTGPKGPIALKDLHGQVVLLDFWGTFCEPCKKSFPKFEALSEKYGSKGFRVVGISEDEQEDRDKIPGFAATYGAKFSLAWDEDRALARRYKPETMPSSFLIDKNGVVRFVHVGFHDGEEAQVESEVRELLGVQ
jgi:cytochrome c biogenesis protein CcmG/thiol:disulfide interchange protein DsbE